MLRPAWHEFESIKIALSSKQEIGGARRIIAGFRHSDREGLLLRGGLNDGARRRSPRSDRFHSGSLLDSEMSLVGINSLRVSGKAKSRLTDVGVVRSLGLDRNEALEEQPP